MCNDKSKMRTLVLSAFLAASSWGCELEDPLRSPPALPPTTADTTVAFQDVIVLSPDESIYYKVGGASVVEIHPGTATVVPCVQGPDTVIIPEEDYDTHLVSGQTSFKWQPVKDSVEKKWGTQKIPGAWIVVGDGRYSIWRAEERQIHDGWVRAWHYRYNPTTGINEIVDSVEYTISFETLLVIYQPPGPCHDQGGGG